LSKKHILYFNSSKPYLKSVQTRTDLIAGKKPDSIKTLDILEVNGTQVDPAYEDFKTKLTQAGIELKVRQVKLKDAILQDLPKRDYDILYILVSEDTSRDPYQMWNSTQRSGDGQNFAELANADVDKLTEQYRSEGDVAKKADLINKINAIIDKEKVAVEYQNIQSTYAISDKVKGFSVGSLCSCESERFNRVNQWYMREKRI